MIIYLYVDYELSYDAFHEDTDQIYRVNQTFIWGENNDNQFASTGPGVAVALAEELPEIEAITRVHTPGGFLVSYKNQEDQHRSFDEQNILAADSNFFKFFSFPIQEGNPSFMLQNPQSLVMTSETAKKYFGDDPAMGKLVQLGVGETQQTFTVTGIIQEVPANSYIDFDIMLSMSSFPKVKQRSWSWIWTAFVTFAKIDEKASIASIEAKLPSLVRKRAEPTLKGVMNQTFDEYIASGKEWNLYLQPITDIRLHSNEVYNRLNSVGSIKTVYALSGAAIFIILLSCVNFMNLTTSQYTKRAKFAGIRKILGSSRSKISIQYISEAVIYCLMSAVLGLIAAWYALPYFNEIIDASLQLDLLNNFGALMVLGGLLVGMSLLSGSYPALFLSAFKPIDAMKGRLKTGKEGTRIRNGLVVFQFVSSIVLIICTTVVFEQLQFFNQKDIGFDRENLLVIDRAEWVNGSESFIHEINQIPGVQSASLSTSVPPNVFGGDIFKADGSTTDGIPINYANADEHYTDVLGLEFLKGRNFSKGRAEDKNGVILNETAMQSLGWSLNEPLSDKRLSYPGGDLKLKVIGVVRDFNYWSLQTPIEPFGIFHIDGQVFEPSRNFVTVRVQPQSQEEWKKTIASLESTWGSFALGGLPFEYEFVDQAFASSFESVGDFGKLLRIFAGLAMLIAGLGLLGMIIYTLEQKTKEIGIRKVVGASVTHILLLVSKSYAKLVLIAFVISTPISIWILTQWLQDYEYRVGLSVWTFVLAGLGTLTLSVLITAYHSLRAANMNPVDVLKDE